MEDFGKQWFGKRWVVVGLVWYKMVEKIKSNNLLHHYAKGMLDACGTNPAISSPGRRSNSWAMRQQFLSQIIFESSNGYVTTMSRKKRYAGNKAVTSLCQAIGVKTRLLVQTLASGWKKSFGLGIALMLFISAHKGQAASPPEL